VPEYYGDFEAIGKDGPLPVFAVTCSTDLCATIGDEQAGHFREHDAQPEPALVRGLSDALNASPHSSPASGCDSAMPRPARPSSGHPCETRDLSNAGINPSPASFYRVPHSR